MANLGNLFFGIGGDDKELRKILEARKKDAVELQKIFSSFNLGGNASRQTADAVRLQEQQNKLALSNLRVQEAQERLAGNSLLLNQRLNNLAEISNKTKLQSLVLDRESLAATERKRIESEKADKRKQNINAAQVARIEQERINKEILGQQRLQTEIQRTEAARRRAALIGAAGQQSYMNSIGLTNRTILNQKALLQQLSNSLGMYFSIYQVGAFVKELAMVSGEFEKQRLSLAAILQDKDASTKIFGQIKDLAVYSPFNFKQLTDYAKQLSAFSIPANELFETMTRLADVSAGLGVDMGRIILAFGQVRSASVLRGQELRQFTEAGIPLVDALAKKFTQLNGEVVTASDVFDKISNREVPFAMIKEIFEDMTNEGGMFFNMQEIQATSLAGKISNLRDAYDIMLDSIGSANSGMLKGSVDGLMSLMNNWEKYWDILKGIILTYGVYRAAIIAVNTAKVTNIALSRLIIANGRSINGVKAAQILLTNKLTASWSRLNKVMAANKIAIIVTVLVALGYAIKTVYDNVNKLDKELGEIASKTKGDADASAVALGTLMNRLSKVNEYSSEYRTIVAEINKLYGEYLPNLLKESDTYTEIEAKLINVTKAIYEKAKAQSYSQSLSKIESELGQNLSKAYDMALESLTNSPIMGYSQVVLPKSEATRVITEMFDTIRKSPELYKQEKEVQKLISDTFSRVFNTDHVDTSYNGLNNYTQLEGMIQGVKLYAKDVSKLSETMDEMGNKNKALFGSSENYEKSIEQITLKYKELNAELNKKPNTTPNEIEDESLKNKLAMLKEMVTIYESFGQQKLANDMQNEISKLENLTKGWRAELNKALNQTIVIQADTNLNDVIDEMKKKYKELKTRMEEQKPILLKYEFDPETGNFPSPLLLSDSLRQMGKNFVADAKGLENLLKAAELMGMSGKNLFTSKEKGQKKDRVTDDLKRQLDLIKDAKKEYDGLRKLMSETDAHTKLTSVEEYKHVKQSDVTDNGYTAFLQKTIENLEKHIKKNPKLETAKNLLVALTKESGGIQISDITKKAQHEIDKIEKYLAQHKDKFNLYKQIFDITGDKGQAAQLAFGSSAEAITTYIDAMKEKLKELSGGGIYEELLKFDRSEMTKPVQDMINDITDAIHEQDFAVRLDMSQIIGDYMTTEERITAIHNIYEEKREKARKNGQSQKIIDEALYAYDKAEQDEIQHLQEELLKLTPFYRQLFADLSDISYRHLKKISDNAKDIVDKITNTKVDKNDPNGRQKYGSYDNKGKLDGYYLPNEDGSISKTLIGLKEYEQMLKRIHTLQKDMKNMNPFASLIAPEPKNEDGTEKDDIDKFASKASDLNSIVQDMTGGLSEMFDALGNEDAADATAFIGEMVGAAANIAGGIASGNPVMVIQGIVGGITSIAKNHDKRLDKAIKKSQFEVKKLKFAYTDLERYIGRQLGAVTESQAKKQIQNLEEQKRQLESQISNEQDKKKSDKGAIADYKNQIGELNDQIRYFYEDLAGEQFGIKIKDWAKTIADSLIDAWSKGEDAAKAFDKTVADIMKNVFKNVLQTQYIERSMESMRGFLFGSDGRGGILGDGVMTPNEMNALVGQLANMKSNLGNWQQAWDYLSEAAKQAGIDLEETVNSDTLSKGIQAVTEDTANLLASYINAMRADLSLQRTFVQSIMQNAERNTNTLAMMQADIMLIQMNTLKTANNSDKLVELSQSVYSILRNASISGSGVKFNIN